MTCDTKGNWFERQRFAWITEMLAIYGYINKKHLVAKFDISEPQASLDFARYQRKHPGAMIYNGATKRYEPAKGN